MKLSTVLTQMIFAATLPVAVMAAPQCGVSVNGKLVLDANMSCVNAPALTVNSDNVTIDLNGHTISCTGAGYKGSCQGLSLFGITVDGKKNVLIKGPGKIEGFDVGVRLSDTTAVTVRDLTVTGPAPADFGSNPRPSFAAGITSSSTWCPANTPSLSLINNDISNVSLGISLSTVKCVKVSHNYVHDINSDVMWSNALSVYNSSSVSIDGNRVERAGTNYGYLDGGIILQAGTQTTEVTNNAVSGNCGNGVLVYADSHDNTVKGNTIRNNGTSSLNGRCRVPAANTFYDLAALNPQGVVNNTYSKNNQCDTQIGPIPAGVCNPGE